MDISQRIYVVLNSVAGMKAEPLEDTLGMFLDYVLELPLKFDARSRCEYARKCSLEGTYPTAVGYNQADCPIATSTATYKTNCEIATELHAIKEELTLLSVQKSMTKGMNTSESYEDFRRLALEAISKHDTIIGANTDEIDITPKLYSKNDSLANGIAFGIEELDSVTHGMQRGSIATIGAFTGQGKSTFAESVTYNSALRGEKCLWFSLELPPEQIWAHFESRYDNSKGIPVDRQNFQFRSFNDELSDRVIDMQPQFLADVGNNIAVVDESMIGLDNLRELFLNPEKLNVFLKGIEKKLGGLDLICIDHVGQIELLFPECGNRAVKTFQTSSKSFRNEKSELCAWLMACQTNRLGYDYADKHGGQYQLKALSDLNEVERSSSYCIFMYTNEEDRNSDNTRMCMIKHRFGVIIGEPFNVNFRPDLTTVGGGNAIDLSNSFSDDVNFGFDNNNVF